MSATGCGLTLKQVAKSYGGLHVIRDASLDVFPGERHAIIGPNGAGKSTLFNLISGRGALTRGEIFLDGRSISGESPDEINRMGLSRSFQINNFFPRLTVFQNVRIAVMRREGIGLGLLRLASRIRAINEMAEQLVVRIGLEKRMRTAAESLTYSEQRALEIGITLATGPRVILLDEPTAGMSREETAITVELIRKTTTGLTLLVVEHDMTVVFGLSDRISVLVNGVILATGTPDEIRNNKAVQTAYLGEVET